MKMLKMSLVSILLVLGVTTNSYAWGDREQGMLLGAGAAVLLGGIINASQQPTRYVETPTYYEPRPTVVYREPVYVQERVIYVDSPRYYYPPRPHYYPPRPHYYDPYR